MCYCRSILMTFYNHTTITSQCNARSGYGTKSFLKSHFMSFFRIFSLHQLYQKMYFLDCQKWRFCFSRFRRILEMMSFSQLPTVKKTYFAEHDEQIFGLSYFVRALERSLKSRSESIRLIKNHKSLLLMSI